MDAIGIIKASIKTHVDWAEYFEQNQGLEQLPEHKYIGDAKFHRSCVDNYKKAINEIEQIKTENVQLKIKILRAAASYRKSNETVDKVFTDETADAFFADVSKLADQFEQMEKCLNEIEAVSCGEKQVAENDSEGLGWIFKRIQALRDDGMEF